MELFDVYPLNPLNIVKAAGCYVWDDKGTKYTDLYGGHAVISIGHSHPHWVKAIEEQLHAISFYSNSIINRKQEELAHLLGKVSGKEDYQLFLCNSGAEANENALKLASFHTGRKKILTFERCFHGRTSLAVAVTDNPSIVAPVNEYEFGYKLPLNDEVALEAFFIEHGNELCAVLIEGIQGIGGIHIAENSFLQKIRTLCSHYGAVYIADAVQCGYGRSGKFFSHDYAGVDADIYTMAKGMGNGFPIGGIIISPHLKAKHGMLGTTFGGNHLACAAAIAVLEVIESEGLIANASSIGEDIISRLKNYPQFTNVRGRGLMIGFDPDESVSNIRKELLNEHHIFTGVAKPNVVRLLPALNIGSTEVDLFFHALEHILQTSDVQ